MSSVTKEQVVEFLENLTLLEAAELVKELEKKFGVSAAAAPVMMQAPAGQAVQAEEKDEFNVVMTDFGANKINVIKEIRALTGLGLKEAKDLVEGVPKEVKTGVSKEEAQKVKEVLEKAGAKVELK